MENKCQKCGKIMDESNSKLISETDSLHIYSHECMNMHKTVYGVKQRKKKEPKKNANK